MSGFWRIKDLENLRNVIEDAYDRHAIFKCIEELWPKAHYDKDLAHKMSYDRPIHEVPLEKRKAFIDMIMRLFDEVCKNENVPVNYIGALYYGTTATVFKVGNKVIKLGGYRYTSIIPNNPYIIKPLLRRHMSPDGSDIGLFIEVTERVEEVYATEEEMYRLYANLRDMGIEWADVKPQNVGRLLKDNVIHWNGTLNPSPETTMLDGELTGEPLKTGDLVILDSDLIYRGKAPDEYVNTTPPVYNCVLKLRKRYELEHEKNACRTSLFPQAIQNTFGNIENEDKKKK